jgi:hypothetical protein
VFISTLSVNTRGCGMINLTDAFIQKILKDAEYIKVQYDEIMRLYSSISETHNTNTQEDFIELRNSLIFKLLQLSVITENANTTEITPTFMSTLKKCTNKIFETYDKMCKIDVGVKNEEK